jgi:transketolase
MEQAWKENFDKYKSEYPKEAGEIERRFSGKLPEGWEASLPRYTPGDKPLSTRKLSELVLNAIAGKIPELLGGAADMAGPTNTLWKGAVDFQHVCFRYICSANAYE